MKKKTKENVWKSILSGNKLISETDSEDMLKVVKELRKEKCFRKVEK
jgi:hypothetical protein